MKSTIRQFMNTLLMSLLFISTTANAQTINDGGNSAAGGKPFDVATYMSTNRTINVMLGVHLVKGVTLTLKDADDTVLYELYLKNSSRAYHHKLNFDGCKAGVYQLEITDGRQTVVRKIEVVDIPAVESQRYVTYSSPTNP